MQVMKALLLLSIVTTIAYMVYVMLDGNRRLENLSTLINLYPTKPIPSKRVVVVIPCEGDNGLSPTTLKAILSQSKRVSDIAVETTKPALIPDEYRRVVTVHTPSTTQLREVEADTLVIFVRNGEWYDYDFVENKINEILPRSSYTK